MELSDTPELTVAPAEAGLRLDLFLARRLGVSRLEARRLLAAGQVRRGGRTLGPRDKGERVASGQAIAVSGFAPPDQRRPLPQPGLPLAILARGEGWVAVAKPAGMPVHPLRADETGTALNAVAAAHPDIAGVGEGGLRGGVVHRLDVDTSGVLLFATRDESWRRLRRLFVEHRIEKTYRAVVLGELAAAGEGAFWLRVARGRPARVVAVPAAPDGPAVPAAAAGPGGASADAPPCPPPPPGARRCGMSWRPLASLRDATLAEARPVTGFLHQVRVTFACLGHPLAGDRLYGPPTDGTGAGRHMLHAARLRWEEADIACPDPDDFTELLQRLA
jgi:23S rRNA pseudouridine1911/1915/1917 synthase